MRRIVWFSAGAASACASKLVLREYPDAHIVYCNTLPSEHPDNKRFIENIQNWIGKEVEIISNPKYKTIDDVFEDKKYLSGIAGAPCTRELKVVPRLKYQQQDDIHTFGFTAEEVARATRYEYNYPEINVEWPLIKHQLTKQDCLGMIAEAKIEIPKMYKLGYKCNNCIGCVKASSSTYWAMIRRDFPETFKRRVEQSHRFGARLAHKTVDGASTHIFIDEIDFTKPIKKDTVDISCGLLCQIAVNDG